MPDDTPPALVVQTGRTSPGAIAPAWHTVAVLVIIAGLSGVSAFTHSVSPAGFSHGKVFGYLTVIVTQWGMVGLVWFGIRFRGLTLRELVGGAWPRWTTVFRDLGVAVLFLIFSNMVLAGASHLAHADGREVARRLLPHGSREIVIYLLLCATAGFCEEVLFRGYLQRQFVAWTRNAAAGLLLQGLVFGAGHAYQGPRLMAVISVYGGLFGLLAMWRRSLRPGMMTHFMQDSLAVLAGGRLS
jgi:uncharacterized protein